MSALTSPFPTWWAWIPFAAAGVALPVLLRRSEALKVPPSKSNLFGSVVLVIMSSVLAVSYLWFGLVSNAEHQRLAAADMMVSALAFMVAWRCWIVSRE